MSSPIVDALMAELVKDDRLLDELAKRLADRVAAHLPAPTDAGYLDSAGAAAYLSCSTGRIRNLVYEGRLKARKDGSRLLFTRADLDAYLTTTGEPA